MSPKRSKAATELAEQKITQLLYEAHALELMLLQTLTAHVAMTPAGAYRSGLEAHLRETRDHAERIQKHLSRRDAKRSMVQVGYGLATGALSQVVAMGKLPIDLVRGTSGEEMLLRNLRDECANEAAEIAMYLIIEQYAREVEDTATERLAASIRVDEERMVERLFEQAPRLVADAVAAEIDGASQFAVLRTGAVDGVRTVASTAARTISRTAVRAARRSDVKGTSARSSRPAVTKPAAKSGLERQAPKSSRSTGAKTSARATSPTGSTKSRSTKSRQAAKR